MSLSLRRYCQHVHYLALTLSSGRNHIGSQYVIYWLSKGGLVRLLHVVKPSP